MGYQNLCVESTCTMALILYNSALCPKRLIPIFHCFAIFHLFSLSPTKYGCFRPVFAIRNDYHIIGDECGSSMVCMQPWFTCSFGLHALCSLLYWVQFVNKRRKAKKNHQNCMQSCRLHGIIIPESCTLWRCDVLGQS